MKEIPLTQGKVAFCDAEDYPVLSRIKWHYVQIAQCAYAEHSIHTNHGTVKVLMHTLIMGWSGPVDHVNNNGLDNQKHNLRKCTHRQNAMNARKRINTECPYKGVRIRRQKRSTKYMAYIVSEDRFIYLGTHRTPEAAAHAYDAKALELFGEFARLNFPIEVTS